MPLTNVQLKQAKPGPKPPKLFDGGGLFLLITPTGQRYRRLKYRFAGKEKLLALGVYPEVTLLKARKLREEAREKLAGNVDPGETRREEKRQILLAAANSFEDVAREWFGKRMEGHSKKHRDRIWNRLETDIFPWLGRRPVNSIQVSEILECLRRIEGRGAIETAGRVRWSCSQVFRYAIASGMAKTILRKS